MLRKGKIAHYRESLDKTLASDDLTDEKKLENLVKNQILRSSEDKTRDYIDSVIEKRTEEVSNFLEMLRSASENYDASSDKVHQASWKLKQDTEEFRVMYREGPVGSPFHSLLVEGYIDAPLDVCLCVSWETALYPRWFPETLIPTFKVVTAKSLQKVRIGEEISLVRVKLSWPLSSREAILQYFEFEYLEDDLVVVLINTIPDVDNIRTETHGFTNEGIPEVGNTVRMDLVGGFALQKVTENRSYFRTIGNLDIKLDFVPPSLINFVARQLIGSGFRLYQKTVASVCKGDEAFAEALTDPLYSRLRKEVLSNSESKRNLENLIIQEYASINDEEQKKDLQDEYRKEDVRVLGNDHVNKVLEEGKPTNNEIKEEENSESNGHVNGHLPMHKSATEIEEEEIKGSENVMENGKVKNSKDTKEGCDSIHQLQLASFQKNVQISPQVEKALGTLDKMISVVRENRIKTRSCGQPGPEIERGEVKLSTMGKYLKCAEKRGSSTDNIVKAAAYVSKNGIGPDGLRSENPDFHAREANPDATSPLQNQATTNWSRNAPSVGNTPVADSPINLEVNGIHENNKKTGQPRKWRICCFHLVSGRLVS